jgi:hypothetical protein
MLQTYLINIPGPNKKGGNFGVKHKFELIEKLEFGYSSLVFVRKILPATLLKSL